MSFAAKYVGLALAAVALTTAPSLAQTARYGGPDGAYRNDPVRAGDRCWGATDALRGYGRWSSCPQKPRATRAARAAMASAQVETIGYRTGHNGPVKVGDNCWVATDGLRGYGRGGACPVRR